MIIMALHSPPLGIDFFKGSFDTGRNGSQMRLRLIVIILIFLFYEKISTTALFVTCADADLGAGCRIYPRGSRGYYHGAPL